MACSSPLKEEKCLLFSYDTTCPFGGWCKWLFSLRVFYHSLFSSKSSSSNSLLSCLIVILARDVVKTITILLLVLVKHRRASALLITATPRSPPSSLPGLTSRSCLDIFECIAASASRCYETARGWAFHGFDWLMDGCLFFEKEAPS